MKICVGSGKGGTGKTTVSLGFANSLAEEGIPVQYIDCDVEEPNAHLFFPNITLHEKNVSVLVPVIDKNKCTFCGACSKFCAYNALAVFPNTVLVFNEMCHSCGGCAKICPENAITEVQKEIGKIKSGNLENIRLIYGELKVGETQSPPLIKAVKKEGDEKITTIIDAPPGTACPFVETIRQSDFCALVTEPTPFGLHDLKIAVQVVKLFKIPHGIIINRSDIGNSGVEDFCAKNNIPILMEISNDRNIAVAYSKGVSITEVDRRYKEKFIKVYKEIYERVGHNKR